MVKSAVRVFYLKSSEIFLCCFNIQFSHIILLLIIISITTTNKGLPWWLSGKDLPASAGDAGDTGSISELGRSPGEGNEPIPVFLPEKFHRQWSLVGLQRRGCFGDEDRKDHFYGHRLVTLVLANFFFGYWSPKMI